MENFIDVIGYEGLYQVGNLGSVKSLGNSKFRKEKILKYNFTNCGYKTICLSKNSKYKNYSVHRLVAIAFIANPENKPQVNHINGVKTDNRICNLEWCNASENIKHAYDKGLIKVSKAEKHINAKLTNKQVLEIRVIGKKLKQREIAEIYGINQVIVSNILNNIHYKF